MKKSNSPQLKHAALREKALSKLKTKKTGLFTKLSEADTLKLIHELEVHQIELELQNEELLLAKASERIASDKYVELFDFAPAGYVTLSNESTIIDINLCGSQILGKDRSSLKNRKFHQFISENSKPHFTVFLQKVFTSKTIETCELNLISDDSNSKWVHLSGLVANEEGQCFITILDITGRIEAEELIDDIIEKNPMSIQIVDQDGFTIKVNPAHTLLFGAVPPPDFSIFDDLNTLPEFQKLLSRARNGKVVTLPDVKYNVHDVYPHFPDKPVWVHAVIFPLKHNSGRKERLILMHEDITDRKNAEEALKKSEGKYRMLAENMSDVIWVLDTETMYFTYVSPSVEKLCGYTPEEIMKEPATKVVTPDFAGILVQNIRKITTDILSGKETPGKTYSRELQQPCKDGSMVWTELVSSYFFNSKTGRLEVLGVSRDISERKKIEFSLKESEVHFREVFETVNIGIAYTSMDGTVLAINKAVSDITELSEEKLVGKNLLFIAKKYLSVKDLKAVVPLLGSLLKGSPVLPFKFDYNNKVLEISTTINHDTGRMTGLLSDITEKGKAEEEVRSIGRHYQALIEKAPDGVVLLNEKACFTFVSQAARRIFGYAAEEKIPYDPSELTHPDDLPLVLTELAALFQDQSYVPTIRYRFSHKTGNWIWVESTFTNLLNDPDVGSIVINFREITERKIAEETLNKKIEELEWLNQMMINREIKMIELKKEINTLLNKSGEANKYVIHELGE
jgi:PAS domain S-box-containing protein